MRTRFPGLYGLWPELEQTCTSTGCSLGYLGSWTGTQAFRNGSHFVALEDLTAPITTNTYLLFTI